MALFKFVGNMELQDCILSRRSIRKFTEDEIPLNDIADMLEHARLAPSAGNTQNWRFVIVSDKEKKKAIADACRQEWVGKAPLLIVVCNYYKKLQSLYEEMGGMFSTQGCAIITSYMQLLAVEKGFGTCWAAPQEPDKIRRILQVPDDIKVEAVLAIGYAEEYPTQEPKRINSFDLCYFEQKEKIKWNPQANAENPMELQKAIHSRRSVRKYEKKAVQMDAVAGILDIARYAPSSANSQNWRFIIITDAAKKKEIAEFCYHQHWMSEAPVMILVCNYHKQLVDKYGNMGKMTSTQNCAIISSYIQLLAAEKGLGTCWIGAFEPDELNRIIHSPALHIPSETKVEAILTLGWPADAKHQGHIRNEYHDFCYFEKWGSKDSPQKKKATVSEKAKSGIESVKSLFKPKK